MKQTSFTKRFVVPSVIFLWQMCLLWAILAYITIYFTDLGFSQMQVGLLVSIYPLSSLALMIPLGIFVDRLPPKKLVSASLVLFGITVFGLTRTQEFWPILLLLIIGGIADSLFKSSVMALYYKTLGYTKRGVKLGLFTAFALVGYGIGPLLGGVLLTGFDMNFLLQMVLLGLIPVFILSFFLQDVKGTYSKLADYRRDLSSKEVLIIVVLTFLVSLHMGVEQTSFSLFLNKVLYLPKEAIGMMFFLSAMAMAVLSVINGLAGDRLVGSGRGLAKLYYLGIIISGLTNIALLLTGGFASVLSVRLAHAVGDSLTMVTRSIIVANLFLASRIGGNLGTITTAVTLGNFAGTLLGGAIPGYITAFVVTGIIVILAIPFVVIAKPKF